MRFLPFHQDKFGSLHSIAIYHHLLVLSSNTFYNYSQLRCHYHHHHREGNLCHCPFHHCQCHCHIVIFSLPIFVTFQQPHVHYTNIVALTYKLCPYENTEKNTKVKSQRKSKNSTVTL